MPMKVEIRTCLARFSVLMLAASAPACAEYSLTTPPVLDATAGRASALIVGDPTPEMTWEGCQLTPGCVEDPPNGNPTIGTVHDGNPSPILYDPNTQDPSPNSPGIYIGVGATNCYSIRATNTTGWIDSDEDGLRDDCEFHLATAFAPTLNVSAQEGCLGGEPYWVAKFIENYEPFGTGDMVKLGYLPSYYADCGAGGHIGDSEFIQLTVRNLSS